MLKRLRLVDISVPRSRRQPMKGRVASVAHSMRNIGLLHPILVAEDGTRLIAGLTRLRAAECLDWKDILCNVVDFDKLHAELAEIDENVERSDLTALEQSQALARRKAIYLELYPETAAGVAGGTASGESRSRTTAESATVQCEDSSGKTPSLQCQDFSEKTPSFSADTAAKTGKSERVVRENVAIGENLAPEAAKILKGTDVEDSKTQLQQLVKLEPEQQVEVAKAIKSGEASSVQEAIGGKPKRTVPERAPTSADEAKTQVKIWADTIGRWLGKSPSIDELRGKFPGKQGDAVVGHATALYEALKNWQKAIK